MSCQERLHKDLAKLLQNHVWAMQADFDTTEVFMFYVSTNVSARETFISQAANTRATSVAL